MKLATLPSLAAIALACSSPALAQFDAYDWTVSGSPGAWPTTVEGDVLTMSVNPPCVWSSSHHAWAEAIVPDTGRFTVDLFATLENCHVWSFCSNFHVAASASFAPCPVTGPSWCLAEIEHFSDAVPHPPLDLDWSIDVLAGQRLRFWTFSFSLSTECRVLATFGNLVFTPALATNAATVSATAGGTVDFALTGPQDLAGGWYVVLGSATGTRPELPLGGHLLLPLVLDGYTTLLFEGAGGLLSGGIGVLDGDGLAQAALTVPPGLTALVGARLHHAYVVLDPSTGAPAFASQAVPLTFAP